MIPNSSKGLGYKQDDPSEKDFRYGASGAPSLAPYLFNEPDLSSYSLRVRDQGGTASCVGQALAAAIDITSLAHGVVRNTSARYLYALAREAERRGRIEDDGSFPRLAMDAANKRGILPEKAFPFSGIDINMRPVPSDAVASYDFRGLRFYRVDAEGDERTEAFDDALRRGYAVIICGPISAAYQRSEGDEIGDMGASIGGHARVLVRCGAHPLELNSWGNSWALRGYVPWSRDYLGRYPMTDCYVVKELSDAL